MMVSGRIKLDLERKGMLAVTTTASSSIQDGGTFIATGRAVAVTAVSISSSVANVFRLQNGGGTSPADDKYAIELTGAGTFHKSFKHPLILDGLAAEWSVTGVLFMQIAYKVLD